MDGENYVERPGPKKPYSKRRIDVAADSPSMESDLALRQRWWPDGEFLLRDWLKQHEYTQEEGARILGCQTPTIYEQSKPTRVLATRWILYLCEASGTPFHDAVQGRWADVEGHADRATPTTEHEMPSILLRALLSMAKGAPTRRFSLPASAIQQVEIDASGPEPRLRLQLGDGALSVPIPCSEEAVG